MGRHTAISSYFNVMSRGSVDELINKRPGETRLGERVNVLPENVDMAEGLAQSSARFVLLGIPEDIGVRANGGVGGAHTAWAPALRSLLNMQSRESFQGTELLVLGAFDFSASMAASLSEDLPALRKRVSALDDEIAPLIQLIVSMGKVPLVIGGGHNNAYPLLKGTSQGKGVTLNCMNLDAHSDYRIMEGRHSGNGFRYAKAEGYLSRYAMVGLHEAYNSQGVIDDIRNDADLHYSLFDKVFLAERRGMAEAVDLALQHVADKPTGIELDLDCITGVLSSAATPTGISALEARQYVYRCAEEADVAYLHLAEGAVELRDGREDLSTAKLIAYLLSDFIRAMLGARHSF